VKIAASPHARVFATVGRETGAKITSLRAAGTEWLLQPDRERRSRNATSAFVAAGLSGWDECVPTIDSCTLADGTVLPDHGSVWDLHWHLGAHQVASVVVPSVGLNFQRKLDHSAESLVLRYTLRNTSARQISVMWAAHPQFNAPPGTVVETSAQRYVQTYPELASARPAERFCIDDVPTNASRKFYLDREVRIDSARIRRADGRWLRFEWDPQLVPHFGVWLDAAQVAHRPVIAIEPGIGWYDDLSRAIANGSSLDLAPGATRRWWLRVTAGMNVGNATRGGEC
jgi:galactose mutarotase-like enzyme